MHKTLFLLIAISCASQAFAQPEAVRKKEFNLDELVIADGYDVVSYFTSKTPVKGQKAFSMTWQGVIYRFATKENLETFRKNPAKYEPAFGGWCAYAMGKSGEKVKIDPETYKIIEGKLYLFYNFWGNNTLSSWNKDEKNLLPAGIRNWSKILQAAQ